MLRTIYLLFFLASTMLMWGCNDRAEASVRLQMELAQAQDTVYVNHYHEYSFTYPDFMELSSPSENGDGRSMSWEEVEIIVYASLALNFNNEPKSEQVEYSSGQENGEYFHRASFRGEDYVYTAAIYYTEEYLPTAEVLVDKYINTFGKGNLLAN